MQNIKETVFYVLIEFYEHFSSMDYRSTPAERRKELLSFTRQHGHDNHHVYLISHKEADFRCCYPKWFYVSVLRMKMQSIKTCFKNKWLRGFKHPLQFFRIEGYSSGDREPQDTYPIWPDKAIFKCYDSNSTGSTLKEINFGNSNGSDRYDDNHGHNFIHNFKKYFMQQGWMTFVIISSVFFGGYYLYKGYKSVIPGKAKVQAFKKKTESTNKIKKTSSGISDIKVTGIFPNKVIWSDNFKLSKGDMYHGLKVAKINARNETIIFVRPNGKLASIPLSGCRIEEKKSDKKANTKRTRKR